MLKLAKSSALFSKQLSLYHSHIIANTNEFISTNLPDAPPKAAGLRPVMNILKLI